MSIQKKPITAIITRTKNRPLFLERAVKSVLAQTDKSYVHVVLNDGGNEKEVEDILAKYPDPRREIIHNKTSVGLTRALNQAIQSVDSDYIAILDDDDVMHKNRIALGIKTIRDYNSVASAVPMEVVEEQIDGNGKIIELKRYPHPESWSGEVSLYKQAHRNYLTNGVIMYSRRVYDQLGGYDESLATAEDWDFGIRLMMKYNVEQVMSDEALVYYHQRPLVKNGPEGNSVHADVREQERTVMILRNNYLRKDLDEGKFGIGFIMNDVEQNLGNVVRLEGHINRNTEAIKEALYDNTRDIRSTIEKTSLYRVIKNKLKLGKKG